GTHRAVPRPGKDGRGTRTQTALPERLGSAREHDGGTRRPRTLGRLLGRALGGPPGDGPRQPWTRSRRQGGRPPPVLGYESVPRGGRSFGSRGRHRARSIIPVQRG